MALTYQELKSASHEQVRNEIRRGTYQSHTAGLGAGFLQTNLVILPQDYALDFMRFCQRNPKPCPLVGVTDTGDPILSSLGADLDLRRDVPAYNIYRDGTLERHVTDLSQHWRDDLVGFALGCSFTFERAFAAAGIRLWHIDDNKTVPMYRSNIQTVPAGPFSGQLVVSLRYIPKERVKDAIAISRQYPLAHGGPVHVGDPGAIGIDPRKVPDWGDHAPIEEGYVPVFWACGVTPQVAIEAARVPLCITHKPGHMLITDITEDAEVPVRTSQLYQ